MLPNHGTLLAPIWPVAGFLLGFLPALISPNCVYVTIHAVETFVEKHYHDQIDPLVARAKKNAPNSYPALTSCLQQFCDDEVYHAHDAAEHYGPRQMGEVLRQRFALAKAWSSIVRFGSAAAAAAARRI
jgi:ubiquinone biosynthesis monooxygenase Coq7